MRGITTRCTVLMCVLLIVAAMSGCSSVEPERSIQSGKDETSDVQSMQPAGGFASSLSEYVRSLLDDDERAEQPMSAVQKAMLERALEHEGKVSVADYEQAWSNYKQCMVDRGYTAPVLVKYNNGIYMQAMINGEQSTDAQRSKFSDDYDYCFTDTALYVNGVYSIQIGNPGLLNDGDQAIVDCLLRAGVTDETYTKQQYRQDEAHYMQKSGETVLDFDNVQTQSCLAANGWGVRNSDVVWKPFG